MNRQSTNKFFFLVYSNKENKEIYKREDMKRKEKEADRCLTHQIGFTLNELPEGLSCNP